MRKTMKILVAIVIVLLLVELGVFAYYMYKIRYTLHNVKTVSNYSVVDTTRDGLFNMSYAPVSQDGKVHLYGYGRPKWRHNKLYKKVINLSHGAVSSITEAKPPKEVRSDSIGEVKGFNLNGQFYVYTNFWGKRKYLTIFPTWASQNARSLYFKNAYKNYLWNTVTDKVVPLFYDILPGPGLTHKNFLFFEHTDFEGKKRHLAVTSVSPHNIYDIDIESGYIQPYSTSINNLYSHFDSSHNLYLSGGPIKLADKGCYLVAGHIAKGGWGGLRMTFFYTFRDRYPFDILSVSEPLSFGFSKRLEYCNQMFEEKGKLYISLGVNDEYSVLLQIKTNAILLKLSPVIKAHTPCGV